jgi:glycosyltransferase involved in cell wall biosynthesis
MKPIDLKGLKTALVYDRVNKWGGAERLLLSLHKLFPNAPLYTSVYDEKKASWARDFKVIPSFLNSIPLLRSHHELVPFLMPFAFESFDFSPYDLVISLTSAEAKGIVTSPKTVHICFCLTPTRYLWVFDASSDYHNFNVLEPIAKIIKRPVLSVLKKWDEVAMHRPDHYIAISELVQKRLKTYYDADSPVIYPPTTFNYNYTNNVSSEGNYFLMVTRLVSYKKIDLVIKVANQLKLPVLIAGNGPEYSKLKKLAGPTVKMLGFVKEEDLNSLYANCKATIVPGEEEFCLSALETQLAGRPVIAYAKSGVAEIIKPGKTGVLFSDQTEESLTQALQKFSTMTFKESKCRINASRFNYSAFSTNFQKTVSQMIREHE